MFLTTSTMDGENIVANNIISDGCLSCKMCGFAGSDVRVYECNCTMHARCVPLSLLIRPSPNSVGAGLSVTATEPRSTFCPCCNNRSAGITKIELFPMSIELLDKAVEIRRASSNTNKKSDVEMSSTEAAENGSLGKRKRVHSFGATMAEATYLLLSSSYSPLDDLSSGGSCFFTDGDFQRTGRWTEQEVIFVDFLLKAFDNGLLPIPHGVRLNDFLCQILLCKGSRLTKKMKNARLSSRSFELKPHVAGNQCLDYQMLSTLQENFLQSVGNEASQLELRFNLTKTWRMQFSNLCVQLGCKNLETEAWLASLEQMEKRAAEAEELIRVVRRKRMGLALKTDAQYDHAGVFFAGIPFQRPVSDNSLAQPEPDVPRSGGRHHNGEDCSSTSNESSSEPDPFINSFLELCSDNKPSLTRRSDSYNDLAGIFNDLVENPPDLKVPSRSNLGSNCGSFLERVVAYMEAKDLPFQHVDVWVPSLQPSTNGEQNPSIHLCHAGHATRSDIDPVVVCQMYEYGEYSSKFSFAPGCGLPGRVFSNVASFWECNIDEADPKYFKRAGGARIYNIKTALGIPLKTQTTGAIVVVFYSSTNFSHDKFLVDSLTSEVARFCPEPKWKLVVDVTASDDVLDNISQKSGIDHHNHGSFTSHGSSTSLERKRSFSDNRLTGNVSPSSRSNQQDGREDEIQIATLLGECMPLSSAVTSVSPDVGLQHFISLRLLLLRPPERRSAEENSIIDMIKKSYSGYALGGRWSNNEMASLIVKDWVYLRMSLTSASDVMKPQTPPPPPPPILSATDHRSHVLQIPNVSNSLPLGAPTRMPFFGVTGNGSEFGSNKRRATSVEDDRISTPRFNIVDDTI